MSSYKSHIQGPSRVFDHVYDPLYTISGLRDAQKANSMALVQSAKLHIIPIYKTMFTDLPRRSRNMYIMEQNLLPHYSYYANGENDINTNLNSAKVIGTERSKYFYMPITKLIQPITKLDLDKNESNVLSEKKCDIGSQTIYRESSAQTKPWMSNAIINENDQEIPEIVYVADLIKSNHFPGKIEADIIERARRRREWEKTLPEILSRKDFERKQTIFQAFEWESWIAREDEIQECQKLRLKIVKKMILRRENNKKHAADQKFDSFFSRRELEEINKKNKLQAEYQRTIRKLEIKHKNIKKKYSKLDIASKNIDKESNLFDNNFKKQHKNIYKTRCEPKIKPNSNLDLQNFQIKNKLKSRRKLWEQNTNIMGNIWIDNLLKNLYNSLCNFRKQQVISFKKLNQICFEVIPKLFEKKNTMNEKLPWLEETDYQNSIFLQKIVKGRAIQNILFRGRNKYNVSISKLRAYDMLYASRKTNLEKKLNFNENQNNLQGQQFTRFEQIINIICKYPILNETSHLFLLFKLLSQELLLLDCQRKFHALYLLSEHKKYQKESPQVEFWEQEQYNNNKTIIASNNDTVSKYLENIITHKMIDTTNKKKIQEIIKCIDHITDQNKQESIQNEEDLQININSVKIRKSISRYENKINHKFYLIAAHNIINHKLQYVDQLKFESDIIISDIITEIIEKSIPDKCSFENPLANEMIEQILYSNFSNVKKDEVDESIIKTIEKQNFEDKETEKELHFIIHGINQKILSLVDNEFDSECNHKK